MLRDHLRKVIIRSPRRYPGFFTRPFSSGSPSSLRAAFPTLSNPTTVLGLGTTAFALGCVAFVSKELDSVRDSVKETARVFEAGCDRISAELDAGFDKLHAKLDILLAELRTLQKKVDLELASDAQVLSDDLALKARLMLYNRLLYERSLGLSMSNRDKDELKKAMQEVDNDLHEQAAEIERLRNKE
ncbi:hypothetical protein JCM10207_006816 [Rhodosporidiobolus poonsookiae]